MPQIMKKNIKMVFKLAFSMLFTLYACGDKEVVTPKEDNLSVKLSAGNIEVSPSNSYSFNVIILSKLPASGVTIKVDVKREDNTAGVYNVQATSNAASSNFTISPLPPGQIYCLATITVTSINTPANTWSGTFRVLWK